MGITGQIDLDSYVEKNKLYNYYLASDLSVCNAYHLKIAKKRMLVLSLLLTMIGPPHLNSLRLTCKKYNFELLNEEKFLNAFKDGKRYLGVFACDEFFSVKLETDSGFIFNTSPSTAKD